MISRFLRVLVEAQTSEGRGARPGQTRTQVVWILQSSSEEWRDLNEIASAAAALSTARSNPFGVSEGHRSYDYSLTHFDQERWRCGYIIQLQKQRYSGRKPQTVRGSKSKAPIHQLVHGRIPARCCESDIPSIRLQEKSLFMKNWMGPSACWAVGVLLIDYPGIFTTFAVHCIAPKTSGRSRTRARNPSALSTIISGSVHSLFPDGFSVLMGEIGGVVGRPMLNSASHQARANRQVRGAVSRTATLAGKLFITENTLNKHFDNMYRSLPSTPEEAASAHAVTLASSCGFSGKAAYSILVMSPCEKIR